jgi:DNA-binding phage protein
MRQTQKLNAAFETGGRDVICAAISALIFATGNVSAFALKAGLHRTMLYRAFKRNLRFDIVLKVMRAADFKLIAIDRGSKRGPTSAKLSVNFNSVSQAGGGCHAHD